MIVPLASIDDHVCADLVADGGTDRLDRAAAHQQIAPQHPERTHRDDRGAGQQYPPPWIALGVDGPVSYTDLIAKAHVFGSLPCVRTSG